jgi:hypothetical protein
MKNRIAIANSQRPRRSCCWAILAAVAIGATGCSSFAPKDLSKLASGGDDQRVAKLAKADPFPSPADVGLEEAPAATR